MSAIIDNKTETTNDSNGKNSVESQIESFAKKGIVEMSPEPGEIKEAFMPCFLCASVDHRIVLNLKLYTFICEAQKHKGTLIELVDLIRFHGLDKIKARTRSSIVQKQKDEFVEIYDWMYNVLQLNISDTEKLGIRRVRSRMNNFLYYVPYNNNGTPTNIFIREIPNFIIEEYCTNTLEIDKYKSIPMLPVASELKIDKTQPIILFADWFEAIVAQSLGITNALCVDVRATPEELSVLPLNVAKFLAYPSTSIASSHVNSLLRRFKEIYDKKGVRFNIKRLNFNLPTRGGFRDFVYTYHRTKNDFDNLVKETIATKGRTNVVDYNNVPYENIGEAANYGHLIETKALIVGISPTPRYVPKAVRIQCTRLAGACERCLMSKSGGVRVVRFDEYDPILLDMYEGGDKELFKAVINQIQPTQGNKLQNACGSAQIHVEEVYALNHFYMIHPDRVTETSLPVFFHRHDAITQNKKHFIHGIPITHPKSTEIVMFAQHIEPVRENIDTFNIQNVKTFQNRMGIFKPIEPTVNAIAKKFTEIANYLAVFGDLEYRRWGRQQLQIITDLVFHSMLSFNIGDDYFKKGYLEAFVIGETGAGKTGVTRNSVEYYQLGDFLDTSNATYESLIGTVMGHTKGTPMVLWGRIPQNNRELLVLDDLHNMRLASETRDKRALNVMNFTRRNCKAMIPKVKGGEVDAKTRMIMVSNPIKSKALSTTPPILVVEDIIQRVDDIRLFDLFCVLYDRIDILKAEEEVRKAVDVVNKYPPDLCRELILWTWTREPDQVSFDNDALEMLKEKAIIMGKEFHSNIPLLHLGESFIKLARMSVATAARMFSTDDGEVVRVKIEHVKFVEWFLREVFASLQYDKYCRQFAARMK